MSITRANNQRWVLTKFADDYRITSVHSGKTIDLDNGSKSNGANIQQWNFDGNENQK